MAAVLGLTVLSPVPTCASSPGSGPRPPHRGIEIETFAAAVTFTW
jgi:hypothetical protein